jgi:LAO/AO transport system kinase
MVDFFLLLLLPGAGDELQGIKRGIIEMADDVVINKADGENRLAAEQARAEQQASLACLQPATPGWQAQAALCSARTGEGIAQVWQRIERFYDELGKKGVVARRRQQQAIDWLMDLIYDELKRRFDQHPRVQRHFPGIREELLRGDLTVVSAARQLLADFDGRAEKTNYDNKN